MPYKFNPLTGKFDQVSVNTVSVTSEVQTLNLTNDTLSISSGNSVDLSGYVDSASIETTLNNTTIIQNIIDGSGWNLPGPYTNEANAASAGVAVGQAYYDNGGTVRVRQE
jgi:hypothetical protein